MQTSKTKFLHINTCFNHHPATPRDKSKGNIELSDDNKSFES